MSASPSTSSVCLASDFSRLTRRKGLAGALNQNANRCTSCGSNLLVQRLINQPG